MHTRTDKLTHAYVPTHIYMSVQSCLFVRTGGYLKCPRLCVTHLRKYCCSLLLATRSFALSLCLPRTNYCHERSCAATSSCFFQSRTRHLSLCLSLSVSLSLSLSLSPSLSLPLAPPQFVKVEAERERTASMTAAAPARHGTAPKGSKRRSDTTPEPGLWRTWLDDG